YKTSSPRDSQTHSLSTACLFLTALLGSEQEKAPFPTNPFGDGGYAPVLGSLHSPLSRTRKEESHALVSLPLAHVGVFCGLGAEQRRGDYRPRSGGQCRRLSADPVTGVSAALAAHRGRDPGV